MLITALAVITANVLCVREIRACRRHLADLAIIQAARNNARQQAQLRADRLATTTPTIRPAGIIRN